MKHQNTRMKKTLTIAFSVIICISLMGCKSSKVNQKESENKIISQANNEENKDNIKTSIEKVADANNTKNIIKKTDMDTKLNIKVQKYDSVYSKEKGKVVLISNVNRQNKEGHKTEKTKKKVSTKQNTSNNDLINNGSTKNNSVPKKENKIAKKGQVIPLSKEQLSKKELSNKLVYSSLSDNCTQNEIAKLLKDSKIKSDNIDRFINTVKRYNSIVGPLKTSTNGFKTINSKSVNYEDIEEYITNQWYKSSNDPVDINCRLTAFSLFKDNIISKGKSEDEEKCLIFDLDAINRNPLCKFKNEEFQKFVNFYVCIPAEISESISIEDVKKNAGTIKKEWKRRKIKFINNSKASMINCFLHDKYTKTLFCGHSGLLVKSDNGFVFIEKYSFLTPYQVTKFNTKEEVKKYLLNRLDVGYGENVSKPIIMENDELM
ncbi:DUF4300 family protein [Clostridium botulinum]|uniref:DUF4300 family protein n=2 Tax=Clostridium botulinum TaxID=1491 RepID=UPI000207509E|nr:DUF4300 family protein [Clostridium botulinum]AEB76456.1 membrane associated lipoprotein [Clostridium botulinum BKT015925]KEI01038.1 hypothetical protein Z953_09265 [Clostridium botulinum D str. 16868]KEI04781.1 hypothetical protein Y848_12780 [Clostridium botulinum C/D str. Sp77]MCD3197513.1 DUF4300 family protein [Clostridium botulinum C/D]MCD3202018.1 DUF4300 family protein [Clostridium botulinum C/D]